MPKTAQAKIPPRTEECAEWLGRDHAVLISVSEKGVSERPIQPYGHHRIAGAGWLGTIPAHWALASLGQLGNLSKGRGGSKQDMLSAGIGCVRYGDLYTRYQGFIRRVSAYVEPSVAPRYKPIRRGDVLFAASGESIEDIGKSAVNLSADRLVCGGDIVVFRPMVEMDPVFLGYVCDAEPIARQKAIMGRGFTVVHIYAGELKRIVLPIPPLQEQKQIGFALTQHDRRINRLIASKRRLIGLLEEQKQAIIHRAVTRGLDPHVRLKPSGIDWLGDVPAHWNRVCVGHLVSLITSGSRGWAEFYAETGSLFIQSGNLGRDLALDLTRAQHVVPPLGAEGLRTKVERDDILICITGALTGNVAVVDIDLPSAFVNQHVALLRPCVADVVPRFFAYALRSPLGQHQFKQTEYGGTKQGLGLGEVKGAMVFLPPLEEQAAIVTRLDRELSNLRAAARATERESNLLREYRTRLVADVVTGKLDVRGVTLPPLPPLPPLPDEPEPEPALDLDDGATLDDDPELMDAAEAYAESGDEGQRF
jgi:type I restriction enzyme, S subunit